MKWPKLEARKIEIADQLLQHHQRKRPLLGISSPAARDTLAMQIISSLRREEYFRQIQRRGPIGAERADPHSPAFEAELGVVYLIQQRQMEEAAWLIFLMVALAKPAESGWQRLRDIYGKLGKGRWDWRSVSADPNAFKGWLAAHWTEVKGKFGNHRKYASIDPNKKGHFGLVVEAYASWANKEGGQQALFAKIVREAGNDPHTIFDAFYQALPIKGFGRLGRFDWAAMLARYGLIHAEAGNAYLKGATGPLAGVNLLFLNDSEAKTSPATLQVWLDELDADLQVGMEVLEDAICNWQKDTEVFKHFKG
jgi:hypothetical protein